MKRVFFFSLYEMFRDCGKHLWARSLRGVNTFSMPLVGGNSRGRFEKGQDHARSFSREVKWSDNGTLA